MLLLYSRAVLFYYVLVFPSKKIGGAMLELLV